MATAEAAATASCALADVRLVWRMDCACASCRCAALPAAFLAGTPLGEEARRTGSLEPDRRRTRFPLGWGLLGRPLFVRVVDRLFGRLLGRRAPGGGAAMLPGSLCLLNKSFFSPSLAFPKSRRYRPLRQGLPLPPCW